MRLVSRPRHGRRTRGLPRGHITESPTTLPPLVLSCDPAILEHLEEGCRRRRQRAGQILQRVAKWHRISGCGRSLSSIQRRADGLAGRLRR